MAEKAWSVKWYIVYIFLLLVALILPSVIAGCRDLTVGTDTLVYMEPLFRSGKSLYNYALFQDETSSIEPLYALLTYGVASCTDNVAWLLFFQQFIIISCIYLSARKLRGYIPICFCIFIYFLAFFQHTLNIVRQMLAMSFCLMSFVYLYKHQLLKSLFVFLIAWGFHKTAFIYLIIYPIFYLVNKQSVRIVRISEIIGIVGAILIIFYMDDIIFFFTSQGILHHKFIRYVPSMSATDEITFPFSIIFYSSFLFVVLQYVRKKRGYNTKLYILIEFLLVMSMALSPIGLVADNTSKRCMFYFLFPSIIFLPMLLYSHTGVCQYPKMFLSVIMSFLLLWWCREMGIIEEVFPYTSEILGIK
jgi:hypothetical protein